MPLLGRMVASPLFVDVRRHAVADLPALLSSRYISAAGDVLVAVGPGQGEQIWNELRDSLPHADVTTIRGGSVEAAGEVQAVLTGRNYDAVVAIGGGRTLDVAKYAATRAAVPMIAVATNLAHDGLCSPVASLEYRGGKGSFGVAMPLGVVVDLDYVQAAPPRMVRSGIGDAVSNLSAIEDWQLASRERGEPIDGLAVTFARTAAEAILHRVDGIGDDDFLIALAEALVLSGMAMSVAGTSRPCSGACHEIIHAVDSMYPGKSNHGELAGIGALFAYFLRENNPSRAGGTDASANSPSRFDQIAACLSRHDLPRTPAEIGLTDEQFRDAVLKAPSMRPDRYTILEHLDLDSDEIDRQVAAFVQRLS